jgi:thiaminase
VPVLDLPSRHLGAWRLATCHPFLSAVREGTIAEPAFDTWLVQDRHFVADLLRFQARLLARAPRSAQAVLAGGAVALVAELDWFEEVAQRRGIDLDVPRLRATAGYAALLDRLDTYDVGTGLSALWVVERVYLDAWTFAAPGAPAYRDFVAHWTAPAFAAYVEGLQQAADDTAPAADVDTVVADVLAAERAFWDMAVDGAPADPGSPS